MLRRLLLLVTQRRDARTNNLQILSRAENIGNLKGSKKDPYDVVIIGGGSVGAGVAYDVATRGLRAAVLESNDFGSGTSSKSTKLIHGGIRYLEAAVKKLSKDQLMLVIEGCQERAHMRRAGGDYLTYAVGMLTPTTGYFNAKYQSIGIKMYEMLGSLVTFNKSMIPKGMILKRGMAQQLVDSAKRWSYSVLLYDGAHNDSRSVMHLLHSAQAKHAQEGVFSPATIANYVEVTDVEEVGGTIVACKVEDRETGESFKVYGKNFINCGGPYADGIRHKVIKRADDIIMGASGIHITFPQELLSNYGGNFGVLIPKTSRGSVCFVLPYRGRVIAGTTDVKEKPIFHPKVTADEYDYLCHEIGETLGVEASVLKEQALSVWKGFRPLVKPATECDGASQVVRSHVIRKEGKNFFNTLGGKWTCYRAMAEDCVNAVYGVSRPSWFRRREQESIVPHSRTFNLPWTASIHTEVSKEICKGSADPVAVISHKFGLDSPTAYRLMTSYGYFAFDLLQRGEREGTNHVVSKTDGTVPFIPLISEVIWNMDVEQAVHIDDIIQRRSGLSFLDPISSVSLVDGIGKVMAQHLGWQSTKLTKEKGIAVENLQLNFPPGKSHELTSSNNKEGLNDSFALFNFFAPAAYASMLLAINKFSY